jgi:hypothetical protein
MEHSLIWHMFIMLCFFVLIFLSVAITFNIARSITRFITPKLQFDFMDYLILTAQIFSLMVVIPYLIVVYKWFMWGSS